MGYQEIFDGVRDALQRHRDDNVRDEFAMAALAVMVNWGQSSQKEADPITARRVYEIADAMLKAREVKCYIATAGRQE